MVEETQEMAPKGVPRETSGEVSTEGKEKMTNKATPQEGVPLEIDKEKIAKGNPMREIKIEKIVLSIGGIGEDLEKGFKLLKFITGRTPAKKRSNKRIPTLNVRPKLEIGAMVTIRQNIKEFLGKMLVAVDNTLKRKQISENNFSFGIHEYIEIPGIEYQRELGIMGFDVTVVFKRTGRRVKLRKVKRGKVSKRQMISKEEIIKFMEDNFQTEFVGK